MILCSNKLTFDVSTSWVAFEFLISSNIVPEHGNTRKNSLFVLLVTHFRVLCCNSERKDIFMIELPTRFYSGLTFDFQARSRNISHLNTPQLSYSVKLHNKAKRQNVVGHLASEYFHFSVYRTAAALMKAIFVEIRPIVD